MSVDWLSGELTTLAFCWRIERRDGVAIGLTAHDRDLAIGGLVYRAAPGIAPSAIVRTSGFEADTLAIAGALSHDAIRGDDLAAGRWDGARVILFAVDWSDPGEPVTLATGELGSVTQRDTGFSAELSGPAVALAAAPVETTSPDCRAELGDRRCRVDMAPRRRLARVVAVADDLNFAVDAAEPSDNAYGYGRLRVFGGAASGLTGPIARSAGSQIELREPLAVALSAGALVELSEGCDHILATCAGRFANAENFRGEPHLPGIDLLTRYPGG